MELFDGAAPVEGGEAVDEGCGAVDEFNGLVLWGFEWKDFFDDDGFVDVVGFEGFDCFVDFVLAGVKVDADEVEGLGDVGIVEQWLGFGEDENPGDDADGDEVVGVVFADGGGELFDPLCGDLFSGAVVEVEGEALDEVFAAELAGEPFGFGFFAGEDGFVHEVVAEDGVGIFGGFCDGDPEVGLCFPAVLLGEFVVPGWDAFFVVTAEAGEVEVELF